MSADYYNIYNSPNINFNLSNGYFQTKEISYLTRENVKKNIMDMNPYYCSIYY